MVYTLESKLGELLQNPKVVKLLDGYVPGASTNPMLALARGMTLNAILSMPQAKQYGLTREKIDQFLKEANALK
jgi:hypothetical protein